MVLRVCRDALGDPHDAADAFQATFLVLARRAGSIRRPGSLAAWLHGVALRVAASSRTAAARRRKHERKGAEMVRESIEPSDPRDEGRVIHEEIARLPEYHRVAVVLCYLEGLSHEQAAEQLGWPVGTIHSRLAWARERLKSRLTRRGLAPSVIPLVGGVVPSALIQATVELAVRGTVGTVPAAILTLTNEILRAYFMTTLKQIAVGLTAAGLVIATGTGLAIGRQTPESPRTNAAPSAVTDTGGPSPAEISPAGSTASPRTDLGSQPGRDPAVESPSILRVRLERALAKRVRSERLHKIAAIDDFEAYEARVQVSLIAGEIESQYEDLRDAIELLFAQLRIRQAETSAAKVLLDQTETRVKAGAGPEIRREIEIRKAQVAIKEAETDEVKIRIQQMQRRLKAIEPLVKLANQSTVTSAPVHYDIQPPPAAPARP